MESPSSEQVRYVRDLGGDRAGWHVSWDGQAHPSKVIAPAGADAGWVAGAVRRYTRKVGSVAVARGRLYSPVDLRAEVGEG